MDRLLRNSVRLKNAGIMGKNLGEEKLSLVAHFNTSGSSESQRRIKKRSKTAIKLCVTSKTEIRWKDTLCISNT